MVSKYYGNNNAGWKKFFSNVICIQLVLPGVGQKELIFRGQWQEQQVGLLLLMLPM